MITVNLLGVAYGVQAFVPRMLTPGSAGVSRKHRIDGRNRPDRQDGALLRVQVRRRRSQRGAQRQLSPGGIHVSAICPGIIDTPMIATGIMRGDIAALHEQATRFYSKRRSLPDEVAQAILQTIAKHKLIVPVPRRQVTLPYVLHRLSPQLTQPIARGFERIISHG